MVILSIILLLFLPSITLADCLHWLVCTYTVETENRRVNLPFNGDWVQLYDIGADNVAVCANENFNNRDLLDASCTKRNMNSVLDYKPDDMSDIQKSSLLINRGIVSSLNNGNRVLRKKTYPPITEFDEFRGRSGEHRVIPDVIKGSGKGKGNRP
jgi:hypothetical protein